MKATKRNRSRKIQKGYNCCQAVACAYCEELGVKEEDMFRITRKGLEVVWED